MVHPVILVVDDEPAVLKAICRLLEEAGYTTLRATSARAALSTLWLTKPDLILSDITMPGLDGFALCREVRANADWTHIPFIFLTGKEQRTDIRQGMALGADDYLTKPFDANELLAAIRARLARADEMRAAAARSRAYLQDELIPVLSHELRTPLTVMIGCTDLLEETGHQITEADFDKIIQGLRVGSERLRNLVEDFLLLSHLESGIFAEAIHELGAEAVAPDWVAAGVVDRFQEQAAVRQVSLDCHLGCPGGTVKVRAADLAQMISRLVDNGIKFSKEGGGHVTLVSSQRETSWVFDVADTGIGIPPDALSSIFEAFHQIDRHKLEQQGAGIGLAITRRLVDIYGGRLTVQSEPGSGSTFTLQLPLVLDDPAS